MQYGPTDDNDDKRFFMTVLKSGRVTTKSMWDPKWILGSRVRYYCFM